VPYELGAPLSRDANRTRLLDLDEFQRRKHGPGVVAARPCAASPSIAPRWPFIQRSRSAKRRPGPPRDPTAARAGRLWAALPPAIPPSSLP
jgi:hypothetical protein